MKDCTKKLAYFVCSFCLIHTKEAEKIKINILIRMRTKKKFIRKKGNLFDLHESSNEWEFQKVKSVQIKSVFFMILVKLFHRKNFINFIQKNFIEKWVWNFTNVVRCSFWYHFYNLKNAKNTHRGVLILVKLYKWYQIAQRTTNTHQLWKVFIITVIIGSQ